MPLTMSSRMSWFVLLALAWRAMAYIPTVYLAARQDPALPHGPHLVFSGNFDSLTSCAPASFSWTYTGPNSSLSLFITNFGVSQDTATSTGPLPTFIDSSGPNIRSLYRRDAVYTQIASSESTDAEWLNLTSLPVPQGRYYLFAIMNSFSPEYTFHSSLFTVQEGTNTSCLASSPTSSTSTLSSSATSSDLASTTSSDVLSSGSPLPTVIPIDEVSSTPVNKGAIAGGVVAGAIVLIAAVLFYFFVACRRRSREHSRDPGGPHGHSAVKGGFGAERPGAGDKGGRWGGLGSVDSHLPPSDSKVQRPYGNQSDGAGASQDEINSYLSRSGSVTYGGYAGSPSEEKFSGSPSEEMVLSTLPYRGTDPNIYTPNNTRSYSASPTSEHRRSQSGAWRTSVDSSSIHAQSAFASPPVSSSIVLAHTPSTGTQNPQRRTARKPVPVYDESSAFPATSSVTSSPPAPAITPFADPVVAYPAYPVPVSSGHYSTRAERESLKSLSSKSKLKMQNKDKSNASSANASSEEISQQELMHKSSFGPGSAVEGRQLHYLIPDMPIAHR